MANITTHMYVGGAAAAITYLAMCKYYRREPTFVEGLTFSFAGVLSSVAPDMLEPALNPNHRQFCHSFTAGILLLNGSTKTCSYTNDKIEEPTKILMACIFNGYLTHLFLDGCTPMGLPAL
jgi:inner membrane protein